MNRKLVRGLLESHPTYYLMWMEGISIGKKWLMAM